MSEKKKGSVAQHITRWRIELTVLYSLHLCNNRVRDVGMKRNNGSIHTPC